MHKQESHPDSHLCGRNLTKNILFTDEKTVRFLVISVLSPQQAHVHATFSDPLMHHLWKFCIFE